MPDSKKSLSIASRLIFSFAFMLLLMGALAGVSVLELTQANARLKRLVEVNDHRTTLARDLLDQINDMSVRTRTIALLTDAPGVAAEAQAMRASAQAYQRTLGLLAAALSSENADSEQRQKLDALTALGEKAIPQLMTAAKQGEEGENMLASTTLTQQARPVEAQWRAGVAAFVDLQAAAATRAVAEADGARQRAILIEAALFLATSVAGALVAWRVTRGIQRPIAQTLAVAERIAAGDFTSDIPTGGTDEMGRLLNAVSAMQACLKSLVDQIRTAAQTIRLTSGEMASGNIDLSHRTETASANLQKTAAGMESLATAVSHSAESARHAHELAAVASGMARRGATVVSQVVATMDGINGASRRISEINGVIDMIAFQINLLSLNAAVEAASAGEHGRGFAVVAEEVRTLARRSAAAAKEIKSLIDDSVHQVDAGYHQVAGAGETMTQILDSVLQLSGVIDRISTAANEQSSGVAQLNASIAHLDQMTQQNSALVEEGAAATESLNEQTGQLALMVEVFKLEAVAA